jgi:hypothetical protein
MLFGGSVGRIGRDIPEFDQERLTVLKQTGSICVQSVCRTRLAYRVQSYGYR